MIQSNFKGYIEGHDRTKIPMENLAFPSKNVIVSKGKITTRKGLENDGIAATGTAGIHSEFVWRGSLKGELPIRVFGQTVQVKWNKVWRTIYTALDSGVTRCYFATFVDINTTITKTRLVIADGSTALYVWNGAIGTVESATTNSVTFPTADGTCLAQGFDDGSVTNQTILHFIGDSATANSAETQNNNPTGQVLNISGTFDTTPVANDVIIAQPVKFANAISSTFNIDVVYPFKNHIVATNFNTTNIYFSHSTSYSLSTGFDFTIPAPTSRTAVTPILMRIDDAFTAMIARKNTLWISDKNDWYKVTKETSQNEYDLWVKVEKFETGEEKGALKMACAKHKGDIVYLAQDKTLQRVTSNEVLGLDEIRTISDDVEAMFERLDTSDARVYYLERAIYIVLPVESTLLILDMIEGYFQPPQTIPLSCISVIGGVKYGHHNAEDSTFKLFSGKDDLGASIESVIAFGLWHGDHPFRYKQHTMLGFNIRLNVNTLVTVDMIFEENAGKTQSTYEIDGGKIKTFGVEDDVSWATHPYAERSFAGADMVTEELHRAIVFKKFQAVSYFDFSPKLTISGDKNEFHLLSMWWDDSPSERKIGNDLFVDSQ